MSNKITLQIEVDEDHTYQDFIEEANKNGMVENYRISQVTSTAYKFAPDVLEHIAEHGLKSLLEYSIALEDITSSSTPINLIVSTYQKFVSFLAPASTLVIVDPYFYAGKTQEATWVFLGEILRPALAALKKIVVISNGKREESKQATHAHLRHLNSNVTIVDHVSQEFHDRYWINPATGVGILMGTSLNGIGKKTSLVDRLEPSDVSDILKAIHGEGVATL